MPNPRKIKTVELIALIVLVISLSGSIYFGYEKYISSRQATIVVESTPLGETVSPDNNAETPQIPKEATTPTTQTEIPAKYEVEVPFMSQAPTYNWDSLHEDACEEASLLMIDHYINKKDIGSRQQFEQEIQDMVGYENGHGYHTSITLKELSSLSNEYLKLSNLQVKNVSDYNQIKLMVYKNGPVIVGAAGKMLGNPNFRNGGPNYHMLVIKGYDQNGFITNDPGTRNGEDYYYKNDVLFNAIHDWNASDITLGVKDALYISS